MVKKFHWLQGICFFGAVLFAGLLVVSCTDDETSTIGFSNNTNNFKVVYLDTLTVLTSTVLVDSIKTSGTNRILAGSYSDEHVGQLSSSSFLTIAPTSEWNPGTSALFDSMVLILNYDGYYYGDTTKSQKLFVNSLSRDLKGRVRKDPYIYNDIPYSYFYLDGGLYNKSLTSANTTELGSLVYTPTPLSGDSLMIRLSNQLGARWLEMAKMNNDTIQSQTTFVNYFKGLKVSADPASSPETVVGFSTASMKVRIYYRDNLTTGIYQNLEHDFTIYNSTLQYNQLTANRALGKLNGIVPLKPISSKDTGNEAFIQAGAGILTKIEFPYLNKVFEEEENIIVTQASLEVPAVTDEATLDNLPSSLGLYYTNKTNVPIGALADDADATKSQTAAVQLEKEYQRKAYYSFPLTSYITSVLRKNTVAPYNLMIGMPATEFTNTVTRLRINNPKNSKSRVKLVIYYTGYGD